MQSSDGFEQFPRARLQVAWARRDALLSLWREFKVAAEKREGHVAFQLPALGTLPDEMLALIRPALAAGCRIEESEGLMWGRRALATKPIRLFPTSSPAMRVLDHVDGDSLLGDVARQLGAETGWPPELAFAYTRGVFLHLVAVGICRPK